MKIWCVKHIDYGRHTAIRGIQLMLGVLAYCQSSRINGFFPASFNLMLIKSDFFGMFNIRIIIEN